MSLQKTFVTGMRVLQQLSHDRRTLLRQPYPYENEYGNRQHSLQDSFVYNLCSDSGCHLLTIRYNKYVFNKNKNFICTQVRMLRPTFLGAHRILFRTPAENDYL